MTKRLVLIDGMSVFYRGYFSGGMGSRIDLDNDSRTDVTFSSPCVFILQLHHGKVTAVETDSDVTMTMTDGDGISTLKAFTPLSLPR